MVQALGGGFADPAVDAARAFRAAMQAMARPGRIETVTAAAPPKPLSVAAGVLVLTLCDTDTPVHLAGPVDTPDIRQWITFHSGAPFCAAENARFALGPWDALLPLERFAQGTPQYPDRSATLIVELADLSAQGVRLSGPGIEDVAHLSLPDVAAFQSNAARFPLGLDFFFTAGDRLAAVPRSTTIRSPHAEV